MGIVADVAVAVAERYISDDLVEFVVVCVAVVGLVVALVVVVGRVVALVVAVVG